MKIWCEFDKKNKQDEISDFRNFQRNMKFSWTIDMIMQMSELMMSLPHNTFLTFYSIDIKFLLFCSKCFAHSI